MKKIYLALVLGAGVLFACQSKTGHDHDGHNHEGHDHAAHADSATEEHGEHGDKHAKPHWGYAGENGPENWANLCKDYATCSGTHQSPIDITEAMVSDSLTELAMSYLETSGCNFVNNGHSVQVNFPETSQNKLTLKGKEFQLKQFHFHCPSEHTVNGEAFPSEAHMVHVSSDGEISVVGVLIKEGAENPFLAGILSQLPKKEGDKNDLTAAVVPNSLLPEDVKYYAYAGSLTTPPCTEGVNWFVLKTTIEASAEQIEILKSAMPANNARPVQQANERTIYEIQ